MTTGCFCNPFCPKPTYVRSITKRPKKEEKKTQPSDSKTASAGHNRFASTEQISIVRALKTMPPRDGAQAR